MSLEVDPGLARLQAEQVLKPIGLTPDQVRLLAAKFSAPAAAPSAEPKAVPVAAAPARPRQRPVGPVKDVSVFRLGRHQRRILKLGRLVESFNTRDFPEMGEGAFQSAVRCLVKRGYVEMVEDEIKGCRGRGRIYSLTRAGMEVRL